ncbi:MAG: hypothetical protein LAQ69_32385 [Acidobacteriia bacterium]|nr:hypothetical protein [Terriglobia bacterium]
MLRTSFAVFLCCGAFAASPVAPTIDQSLSMKSVAGGAQISPDGRYVAYTVQQTNWDENDFVQQIWIAVTATGDRYQLTSGKKSSNGPQWAPDSRRLAFLSDRDGKRQIYVIAAGGGEAAQLTTEDNGVGALAWSPDAASIAFGCGSFAFWAKTPSINTIAGMRGLHAARMRGDIHTPAGYRVSPKLR